MEVYVPKSVDFLKVTRRGRGRPRKVELLPENKAVEAIVKARDQHVGNDGLLKALKKDPNSLNVLDQIVKQMAYEASMLDFERQELQRKGEDASVVSGKKILALARTADLYFKKRDAVLDQAFDFKSKRFEKLLEWLFMKVVKKSAQEAGLSGEQLTILFNKISEKFEDERWTEDAMAHIKS